MFEPRRFYINACSARVPQLWVWDGDRHNDRRRALFPGYKIRDYTGQEDIFTGLDLYRELLLYSPAVQVEVPEYEADDVCAVLARKYAGEGVPVSLQTNDFDFHQLSGTPNLTLKGVPKSDGIAPHHVSAYKAFRGDPSDRIPGVEGFGHKSWEAMAVFHDDINDALASRNATRIRELPFKPKVRLWLSLDENIERLFTYYEITRFLDVPTDLIEQHTYAGTYNPGAAELLLKRFLL